MAPPVTRFEIVTSSGRGAHLAAPGESQAICTRPVMARTGREGGARTPHLCQAGARTLAHLEQSREVDMTMAEHRYLCRLIDIAVDRCEDANLREQLAVPGAMLLGRLLADPELHRTPTGERVATFHAATAGAASAAPERWRCLAWNQGERQLADLVVEHLRAGDVFLRRRLEERQHREESLLLLQLPMLQQASGR